MFMNRRSFLYSSGALLAGSAFALGHSHAEQSHSRSTPVASLMAECANRLLNALDANQRSKATFAFDTGERKNWHFIPNDTAIAVDSLKQRTGLSLREMSAFQKHLASGLLAAGLSQVGYIKAVTIMSLEDELKRMERDTGAHRNPEHYYVSIFGTPSNDGAWGYRIEGHHLSQNYTIVKGRVIDGPSFFGANPAEVRQGSRRGLRTLAAEDDLGMQLISALDEPSRKIAIVNSTAYPEILTGASRKAALKGQPSGLPASKMNRTQFDALVSLMEEYARNVPDELAEARIAQLNKAGREIHFAWSGGINRGDPHYYRVQTPYFLIELDDTQDDANHVHSVWRDFQGDFGEDLLQQHYRASHKPGAAPQTPS
jgi:hypothetical protein